MTIYRQRRYGFTRNDHDDIFGFTGYVLFIDDVNSKVLYGSRSRRERRRASGLADRVPAPNQWTGSRAEHVRTYWLTAGWPTVDAASACEGWGGRRWTPSRGERQLRSRRAERESCRGTSGANRRRERPTRGVVVTLAPPHLIGTRTMDTTRLLMEEKLKTLIKYGSIHERSCERTLAKSKWRPMQ